MNSTFVTCWKKIHHQGTYIAVIAVILKSLKPFPDKHMPCFKLLATQAGLLKPLGLRYKNSSCLCSALVQSVVQFPRLLTCRVPGMIDHHWHLHLVMSVGIYMLLFGQVAEGDVIRNLIVQLQRS